MRLTRETEYALKGLLVLARRPPGATVPLADLARADNLPSSFLAKIFQKLARHGILSSRRGPGHGYRLAVSADEMPLLRVIEAIQGTEFLDGCVFWSGHCGSRNPCLLHARWQEIKPQIRALLEKTTLADLAIGVGSELGAVAGP